ncbi:phage tail assembly chaperone [Aeromonas veronii]|uniref:phage tail assembly chaperone n=1 Tax=Aeromonas veronii TaxID=654 RepID=UPI003A4E050D
MTIDWTQRITQDRQTQQRANSLRAQRDVAIRETSWLVERHRDEQDATIATTLTAEQYAELLAYRQQLRDLPSAPGWPAIDIPQPPVWLAQT